MKALSLAVVGVEFPNKRRGPTRRFAIDLCRPGDPVQLVAEPKNPADPYAVMVLNREGMQMGYVTAERAPMVSRWIGEGREIAAIFQGSIRGGAWIRVALDGEVPSLPEATSTPNPMVKSKSDDSGFYPDADWPDE